MTVNMPIDNGRVDGQVNCHVRAGYCHDKKRHYPGLAPGFFLSC